MRSHGVLAIVLTALLVTACGPAREAAHTTSARVVAVLGEVLVDGLQVSAGDVIPPVFRVTTGVTSTVEIVFDDKNILRIAEETEAYIDLGADIRTVELRTGAVASALRKLTQVGDGDRFRVKTRSTVAGVRGTVFYVRVEDPEHTYLCTCNGTLHLTDALAGNPMASQAQHHQGYRFQLQPDGSSMATPAGMEYHTDADLEDLAAGIGETIDWTRVEG